MRGFFTCVVVAGAVGCSSQTVPTGKYFSGEPVPHWLEQAKSPDAKLRKKAIEVLGNVGPADSGTIPALVAALKDSDAGVRDAAVLGLSKIGPAASSGLPALRELLTDKDPTVRKHVQVALTQIQGTGS